MNVPFNEGCTRAQSRTDLPAGACVFQNGSSEPSKSRMRRAASLYGMILKPHRR